jgi:hypothetical protein
MAVMSCSYWRLVCLSLLSLLHRNLTLVYSFSSFSHSANKSSDTFETETFETPNRFQ